MEALFGIAVALGAALGLDFKGFVMVPASLLMATSTGAVGVLTHRVASVIVVDAIAIIAALQFAYLASSFLSSLLMNLLSGSARQQSLSR